jgi:cytochrome c
MKKIVLIVPLLATLSMGGDDGKKLFEQKCSSCHSMIAPPPDRSKMVAPPAKGITIHLKMVHPKKDDFEDFLIDYVFNPTKEKALCMKRTIKRFGLMPSQKGVVTKDELEDIAEFLFENYAMGGNPEKMHQKMMKQMQSGGDTSTK